MFECDQLLRKDSISDDLIIEKGIAKHIKRIGKTKYNVTYLLDKEIITDLGNYTLKLFEGDNYIYIKDEYNNILKAEYVIKNEFTDLYVTDLEMKSAIEESADKISLSVTKVLTGYSTTEETKALLKLLSDQINLEVSKKVGEEEIINKINLSSEGAEINANKISLKGKQINLTGDDVEIKSNSFNVDKNGNVKINSKRNADEGESSVKVITDFQTYTEIFSGLIRMFGDGGIINLNSAFPFISLYDATDGNTTQIWSWLIKTQEVNAKTYSNDSLESLKKNFERLENGLDIIKNTEIYRYNLKTQDDNDKKHIGFVIGKDYNYSSEITSTDKEGNEIGADLYGMISASYKAIQELAEQNEQLQKRIKTLEQEVLYGKN